MPTVFLSYSREDLEQAGRIAEQLAASGVTVWRDQEHLHVGQTWPKALGEAIALSDAVLLLWSVDRTAWADAGGLAAGYVALEPGERLGPYEIVGKLGAGGMGDFYRASDTRLGRQVAVKISRERFSGRFEREARAISALNHPSICTLHDIGPDYVVMELVEGVSPARLAQARSRRTHSRCARTETGNCSIDRRL